MIALVIVLLQSGHLHNQGERESRKVIITILALSHQSGDSSMLFNSKNKQAMTPGESNMQPNAKSQLCRGENQGSNKEPKC